MHKKLKPAIVPIHFSLPADIGNKTLNELLLDNNTEFSKKRNRISIKRATDIGIATLEIETFDTGRTTFSQSTVPSHAKKSEYINDIVEMKKQGMKQKDIAFQLGISESYVTKLLKSEK